MHLLTFSLFLIFPISGQIEGKEQTKLSIEIHSKERVFLITPEEILGYDDSTKTFTLKEGVIPKLADELRSELLKGVPFYLTQENGKVLKGVISSAISSFGFDGYVIVIDLNTIDSAKLKPNQFRLDKGFPEIDSLIGK